jgi:hypothetical protein
MKRWWMIVALSCAGCSHQTGITLSGDMASAPRDASMLGDAQASPDAASSTRMETSHVTASLRGVWGSSATNVYVVGASGTILHSSGDGNWTAQTSGTTQDLYDVWGSGPNDLYAVGNVLLHSTGDGTWQTQTGPSALMGVWGSSATDVYVAGAFGVSHSTGNGTWTNQTQAEPWGGYFHVRGSTAGNVYALGGLINLGSSSAPGGGVATFAASMWSWRQLSPGDEMKDIAFTATGEFIVGLSGQIWARGGDSGTWTQQTAPGLSDLQAIWADGNGKLYAVSQTDGNIITSSGNGSWSVAVALGVYDLWGIWGSGPDDIYVVGDNGAIIHLSP